MLSMPVSSKAGGNASSAKKDSGTPRIHATEPTRMRTTMRTVRRDRESRRRCWPWGGRGWSDTRASYPAALTYVVHRSARPGPPIGWQSLADRWIRRIEELRQARREFEIHGSAWPAAMHRPQSCPGSEPITSRSEMSELQDPQQAGPSYRMPQVPTGDQEPRAPQYFPQVPRDRSR